MPRANWRDGVSFHIHVGFARTGTKLLQKQVFPNLPSHRYLGIPHGNRGGAFAMIRHLDEMEFSLEQCENLMRENLPADGPRALILSDETMTEVSHWFFTPDTASRSTVADRLHKMFGPARILFTIRNQKDYVFSVFKNIVRNYMEHSGVFVPDFETWYWQSASQFRSQALRNVDFSIPVKYYVDLFGIDAVEVIPIEFLQRGRFDDYRAGLDRFLGVSLDDLNPAWFAGRENESPTAFDMMAYRAVASAKAPALVGHFARQGKDLFEALRQSNAAPHEAVSIDITPEIARHIDDRCSSGNRWLADNFRLPLESLGYSVGYA